MKPGAQIKAAALKTGQMVLVQKTERCFQIGVPIKDHQAVGVVIQVFIGFFYLFKGHFLIMKMQPA